MSDSYLYNLGQLFEKIAKENSDKNAIQCVDDTSVSYNKLNVLSNKIAHYLLQENIKRNDVIAILNNKTPVSYAIMIACLKIGATYTNIDPKSPIERFNRMVAICNPKLLFYYQDENIIINEFSSEIINTIDYSSNEFANAINKLEDSFPRYNEMVNANTPVYIMFTSGSTGFPKGVVISHQNILNFIKWSKATYHTTVKDVFTNINPMHFDNSVFDFYSSLFTGAAIVPVNENLTRNPRKLLDALNQVKPTVWFSVPSMLVYVLNMRALKETDLPTLRVVTYGGEGFPKNQLKKLWQHWGNRVRFVNVYGPTECTCICSSYDVSEIDMENDDLLPLGHMAPNFYGLVLDENGDEVKVGEVGELCLGGPNVGIGYYNNLEKTEEVFISNPVITTHKEMVYKSGDLVKQDAETKMFLFCGRKDNQIKRMGYRIELEEIENAFNAIEYVKESAVIYLDNEKYPSKIIACLNSNNEDKEKTSEVLKKYLPSYMLPDLYFYFAQLPKNQNGKIDRLKLKEELS
ncbi:MAG: amino acid adenylation domain-containing protein [Vicingus serpentipes]|nr:amino acid adenylation domain-containing protein [Vicingus serpentipes]